MNPSIPASDIVSVTPSVLSAGSPSASLNGLMLTTGTRVPIGTVLSLPSAAAASAYFGAGSAEALAAATYFAGYVGATAQPSAALFAQYPAAAVSAFIRGGPLTLTLAALQAIISGTLTISVDGYSRTSSSINLSTASSFTAAAALIQTALDTSPPTEASFTGVLSTNTATASINGNQMTVSAILTGCVSPGQTLSGTGLTSGALSVVSLISGTAGGTGVYLLSGAPAAPVSSETITLSGGCLSASSVTGSPIAVGQTVAGSGVTVGTVITGLGSGTGAAGTYAVNTSQTVASESMTTTPTNLAVTYDTVSGAFVITSGVTGTASTVAFATGGLATTFNLTSATGALLSQGAAATTPSAFMTALIAQTTAFATFSTLFNPDASGNANKEAFAAWNGAQNNQFAYIAWDTDVTPTNTVPASSSLGQYLITSNVGGTAPVYDPSNEGLAPFIQGAIASINTNRTNGRADLCFRSGNALSATVTSQTALQNLIANGYNAYAAFANAVGNWVFLNPGLISGPFQWLDSYVNQIWLNTNLQTALMNLVTSVGSIPYNNAGSALIEAAVLPAIQQAVNFGAITPNVALTPAQILEVNTVAGTTAAATALQTQGWYFQVLPASGTARAARTSPPINFWYVDGGSVQQISLSSVEVQ